MLAYVVFKFYQELRVGGEEHHGESKAPATLGAALWTIIIADLSMSLDNVLGVAGAAHGNALVLHVQAQQARTSDQSGSHFQQQ